MRRDRRRAAARASAPGAGEKLPVAGGGAEARRRYFPAAGLILATVLAYSNSFSSGFVLDNQTLLLEDPRIQAASGPNLALILRHSYWWPNGESGLYRPLTTLSYLLNYAIFGNAKDPAGYHWVNLALHVANVLLVLVLVERLAGGLAHGREAAWVTALLWAVHPVLTESVTNIVGRADLLAGCAVLCGLLLYLKSARTTDWPRMASLAGLALAAAAGACSKESAAVLPALIVLYEVACGKRWRKMWAGCLASFVPIAAVLWQRYAVLSSSPPAEFGFLDNPIAGAGFWTGRLTAIKILPRYLWLSFWPQKLSSDYSYDQIALARGSIEDWIGWLAAGAALAVAVLLWHRARLAFFFAGFAFLNLLPASNLLFPTGAMMAERFLYLPLAGVIAATVAAVDGAAGFRTSRFRHAGTAVAICVCAAAAGLAVRTWIRNLDWKNDETMAAAGVQTSPRSFKFHRLLAFELLSADPPHRDIGGAVSEADRSLAILAPVPDDLDLPGPWNLAAVCHRALGDTLAGGEARAQYQTSVRLALRSIAIGAASRAAYDRRHGLHSPVPADAAEPYLTLAAGYLRLGMAAQALDAANQAQSIDPSASGAYEALAGADLALGRAEAAAVALTQGLLATGDRSLLGALLKLYRSGLDSEGCAVTPGANGPTLNPRCGVVLRDLCAATARMHRADLGRRLSCPE
jgi:tetratricopeptide (TPR) repeat protein